MATYTVTQVLSQSTTTLWFCRQGVTSVTITQCSAGCTFAGATTGSIAVAAGTPKAVVISGAGTITLQFTATYGVQTEMWTGAGALRQSNWCVPSDINQSQFTGVAIGSGGSGSNDTTNAGGGGGGGGCDTIIGSAFDTLIPTSMLPIQIGGATFGGSTGNTGADTTVIGSITTLDGQGGMGGSTLTGGIGGSWGNSGTRGGSGAGPGPTTGGGGGGAGGSTGNGGAGSGQNGGIGGTGSLAGGGGGFGGNPGNTGGVGSGPGGGGAGNGTAATIGGPPLGAPGEAVFSWLTFQPGVGGGIIGGGVGGIIGE